jgi:hypothetical protein
MTIDDCISLLTQHQRWRTSKPPYDVVGVAPLINPADLTAALDFAIEGLHRLKGLEKE